MSDEFKRGDIVIAEPYGSKKKFEGVVDYIGPDKINIIPLNKEDSLDKVEASFYKNVGASFCEFYPKQLSKTSKTVADLSIRMKVLYDRNVLKWKAHELEKELAASERGMKDLDAALNYYRDHK